MTAALPTTELHLDRFFPYQMAVLSDAISRSVAQIYAERFDLSRDEWRVLAGLAGSTQLRTADLMAQASLDKVSISRALARLESKQLIVRQDDPVDRRSHLLRLRPAGRALYKKIVPLVLAREQFLLESLTDAERLAWRSAYDKLLARAQQLTKRD